MKRHGDSPARLALRSCSSSAQLLPFWERSASNPSIKHISASLLWPIKGCGVRQQSLKPLPPPEPISTSAATSGTSEQLRENHHSRMASSFSGASQTEAGSQEAKRRLLPSVSASENTTSKLIKTQTDPPALPPSIRRVFQQGCRGLRRRGVRAPFVCRIDELMQLAMRASVRLPR